MTATTATPPEGATRAPILALTVHQPWATLLVRRHAPPRRPRKPLENRTWPPPPELIGGWLAIHAGKTMDEGAFDYLAEYGVEIRRDECPLGVIVGVGRLAAVHAPGSDPRRLFNFWYVDDSFAWQIDDAVPFMDPIAARGAQKLWRLPPELLERVRLATRLARDEVRHG